VDDYRDVVFSQGLVCLNTNNNRHCVVIDGQRGSEIDRVSLVLEYAGDKGFMMHTPPNRALKPTGKICNIKFITETLNKYVVTEKIV